MSGIALWASAVGHTEDLSQRSYEHNLGLLRSTKPHRPWTLVYYEPYSSRSLAARRE
ncbi:MAG: GIY-YIG nuclease family protein [Armatimonadetes bacterium]|nr:GIY-YIG nuclease family protein [Armatimonadota bacterium]